MDFDHLTILSFHKTNGNCIDNSPVANQPEVLIPVIDRPVGDRHKQDIKFFCV
jgi:hypothetical protein